MGQEMVSAVERQKPKPKGAANVDEEFMRLKNFVKNWVKPPTKSTMGRALLYFRDPDGNLIDFYARVKTP